MRLGKRQRQRVIQALQFCAAIEARDGEMDVAVEFARLACKFFDDAKGDLGIEAENWALSATRSVERANRIKRMAHV
jgi:hypothetical protein